MMQYAKIHSQKGKYGWYSCLPISRTESSVCTLEVEGLIYPSIARGFHPMWDDLQFDWKSFFFVIRRSVVQQKHIESWFGIPDFIVRMEKHSKLLVGCFTLQEILLKYHQIPMQRRMNFKGLMMRGVAACSICARHFCLWICLLAAVARTTCFFLDSRKKVQAHEHRRSTSLRWLGMGFLNHQQYVSDSC